MDFCNFLQMTDFTPVMNTGCPDKGYNIFQDLFKIPFEQAFHIKKFKLTKRMIKREPWITNGILINSAKTKSKLLKKKLNNPTQENIAKYKNFCTLLNKVRKKSKRDYIHNKIKEYKNDSKNL